MTVRAIRVVGAGMLIAAATLAGAQPVTGFKPAAPQPTADQLAPGLSVGYVYGRFNHIKEFMNKKFEPGPPLAHLDWPKMSGLVLTSKEKELVAALITGFIRFEKAGTYGFDVTSNDGVRVEIGGKLLYEDPTVHGDDTSDRIDVKIDQPGWYALKVLYFQKKGSAALQLRWLPAGADPKAPLVAVPAAAFARLK
jgi:PA14 domain